MSRSFRNQISTKIQHLLSRTITTESGCMEWQGCCNDDGYGQATVFGKWDRIHRHIYRLIKGEIPEGLHVLHSCDNRPCINIEHLFLGTNKDNMDDRDRKGRQNHFSKVTKDEKEQILILIKSGVPYPEIEKSFPIKRSRIQHIANLNNVHRNNLFIPEISAKIKSGILYKDIAKEFGIHYTTVSKIGKSMGISRNGTNNHKIKETINESIF